MRAEQFSFCEMVSSHHQPGTAQAHRSEQYRARFDQATVPPEGTDIVELDGTQDVDRLKSFARHKTLQVIDMKRHLEDHPAWRGERLTVPK
jgi:hypothetical protein